jgi:choline dehydrogenase
MYVPLNPDVYLAAYNGAYGSMTASMRVPTNQSPAVYAGAAKAAGAWAESFDTEWNGASASPFELDAIGDACESTWDGLNPPNTPAAQTAATYTKQVIPLIASITAASAYLASSVNPGTNDYVIVGLGTAGAPLAKYLSDPLGLNKSVLVLEAGVDLSNDPRVQQGAPFGDFTGGEDPKRSDVFYTNVNDNAQVNPQGYLTGIGVIQTQSGGRMWGGSSGHNYLEAVRGSNNVYDDWGVAAGDASWNYNGLLPLMKKLEHYTSNGSPINLAERGTLGPLFLTQDAQNMPNPFGGPPGNSAPLLAAMAAGSNSPARDDYNDTPTTDPTCNVSTSLSQWYVSPGDNKRSFSATAFMPNTVVDPNTGIGVGGRKLKIVSGATVIKVVIENTPAGPTCTGVLYYLNANPNDVLFAKATVKVILCGGALSDPALLQRSGVGDVALLTSQGIPVVVANPNVGKNLQCHVGTVTAFSADPNPANNPSPLQFLRGFTDLSGTVRHPTSRPNDSERRLQIAMELGFNVLPANVLAALPHVEPFATIFTIAFLVAPKSRGTVKIVSNDALTKPRIDMNFLDPAQPNDSADVVAMMKVIANISLDFTGTMPAWPPATHYPSGAHPNYGPEGGTATEITIDGLTGISPAVIGQTIAITAGASPNVGPWTIVAALSATSVKAVALHPGAAVDLVNRTWVIPAFGIGGAASQVSAVAGSDFKLLDDGRSVYIVTNHCVGTCIMGTSAANAVVDKNLDVFGVNGLSVASNAVMPEITTGNTAYPAYVIGMKKALIEGATI